MRTIKSPPLLPLILLGFLMVSLPLIGAIMTAIVQVNAFSKNSQSVLVSVKNNTYNSTVLTERITLMERSARQYQALLDVSYKARYLDHREEVLNLFQELQSGSNEHIDLQNRLGTARNIELITHDFVLAINNASLDEQVEGTLSGQPEIKVDTYPKFNQTYPELINLESAFNALREEALAIVLEQNNQAQTLINAMPKEAEDLQNILVGQAVWVIPLSGGLGLLFALFIAKPLRQIHQAIRSLGRGSLARPISVTGSSELEELGRQLNLLRIRLIELEAQKVQFLRNVSHELKTPLTSIREASELLFNASQDEFESDGRIIVPILLDNSIRLQKMIEELLVFGADNDLAGKHIQQPVHLNKLVEDAAAKQRMAIKTHAIKLVVNTVDIEISGNPKQLGIIVDNLLSNAIKYTPDSGHIFMDLSVDENERAVLDIRDSGKGVSTIDQPHLFDWFYTGEKPEGAIMLGTGMGLAISQEYAAQQDGEIQLIIDSDTPAKNSPYKQARGAHFRLSLVIHPHSNVLTDITNNTAATGIDQ